MRIIAGSLRSRSLQAPPGLDTRPTSDRLRETLFNVLAPRIQDARVLDLYAGSGAVGIEAMSRGAAQVVFVEKAQSALKVLRANLERLGLRQGIEVHPGPTAAYLRRPPARQFDVVFLDPPYDARQEYESTLAALGSTSNSVLAPGALVIAEHRRNEQFSKSFGSLVRTRLLQQGDSGLSFYQIDEQKSEEQESKS